MNGDVKKVLEESDFDVDGAIRRFVGNEELYLMVLRKYGKDPSYDRMLLAMDQGNAEEAFQHAHTLKGISSNLGIGEVTRLIYPVVEMLRAGDIEGARGVLPKLKASYQSACELIQQL